MNSSAVIRYSVARMYYVPWYRLYSLGGANIVLMCKESPNVLKYTLQVQYTMGPLLDFVAKRSSRRVHAVDDTQSTYCTAENRNCTYVTSVLQTDGEFKRWLFEAPQSI